MVVLVAGAASLRAAVVADLRCDGVAVSLGMDDARPRLSWRVEDNRSNGEPVRDQRQTAYQVLVATSLEALASDRGDLAWRGQPGVARALDFQRLDTPGVRPGLPAPWFRKEFELAAAPDSAQVTVCSPGYVELYVNGDKVGGDVLTPAVSDLKQRTFSVTYDVRSHLRAGRNCIGLWAGNGWADVIAALPWQHCLHYGDRRILEENFDAARRYIEYLDARSSNDILRAWGSGFEFIGDWVPPRRGMDTQNWPSREMAEFFCNCYRVYLWQLVGQMTAALGRPEEASRAESRTADIRSAAHAAFYDAANKRYAMDAVIPPNSTATVFLPDGATGQVGAGRHRWTCREDGATFH